MTAVDQFTGETEFSKVVVHIDDSDPEEWPTVYVTVGDVYDDTGDSEHSIALRMDEARQVIAGLAAVIR